jgi:hypothetical protein
MRIRCSLTLATLTLLVSFAARGGTLAGPITNAANGHIYFLLTNNSWTASEADAVSLGGHLVTINDFDENQWVMNTFMPLTGVPYASLWIGLNDATSEGHFVWASREPVTFTYWYPGEPNNAGTGEDYATIRHPSEVPPVGSWNDLSDNSGLATASPIFGVVEVDPTPKLTIDVASVAIKWYSATNSVYQLQYRSSLTTNAWVNLGLPISGTGSNVVILDSVLNDPRRIYRLQLVP